jgi:hypothetical protein
LLVGKYGSAAVSYSGRFSQPGREAGILVSFKREGLRMETANMNGN